MTDEYFKHIINVILRLDELNNNLKSDHFYEPVKDYLGEKLRKYNLSTVMLNKRLKSVEKKLDTIIEKMQEKS